MLHFARRWLNAAGLVLGAAGVVVVWAFALPQPSFDQGTSVGLDDNNLLPNGRTVREDNIYKQHLKEQYQFRTELGLSLILGGFLLQLLNEILPKVKDPIPERRMSFQEHGFLDTGEGALIATIRQRHAPWFALIDKLNRLAMGVLLKEGPRTSEGVYVATLYARAVTMYQGAVRLAERGLAAESKTLVRGCAETAIALGCVRLDMTFYDRLDEDYDKHRISLANELLKHLPADDPNLTPEMRAALTKFVADLSGEYEAPKPRRINWADAAIAASMTDLYITVYRETSADGAHVSLKALERHVTADESGNITGFRFRPEVDGAGHTLSQAIACILNATDAKLKGGGDSEAELRLRALTQEWDALVRAHPDI